MTPIEIIALILIVLGTIKILLIPNIWMKVVKFLYSKSKVLFVVEFLLAVAVFYYLLQSGFTIVQILAVVAFGGLLTGMVFALYAKETLSWAREILKKGVWKKAWFIILIWVVLLAWGALELFNLI